MTAPVGYGENRCTIYVSPRTRSAGASGAMSAERVAAAPRALAPIYRLPLRIARRSLYGLRVALPAPTRKNLCAGLAGIGESLPFLDRRHPMRPSPTRDDLERNCWRSWKGRAAPAKRGACRPLPYHGGDRRARVWPGLLRARPRPAPKPQFPCASGAFRSIPQWPSLFSTISAEMGRAAAPLNGQAVSLGDSGHHGQALILKCL